MQKLLVALALSLLSVAIICAQKKQSDREHDGLKGPVKSVSVESATLIEKEGRQVEEQRRMAQNVTYNAEGNRVNDEWYNDGELFIKNVYSYAGANKVVDKYVAFPKVIIPPIAIKGDSAIPAQPASPPKTDAHSMQRMSEIYKYKYNAGGNITELSIETESRVKRRSVFNLKGQRREMLSYDGGNDLDYRRVETLDAQGNVVESAEFETKVEDGEQKYSYTAYELDARGNWVKRLKSAWETEGDKPRYVPVQVEYRTIVYF
jgi:hypothetical protein